MLLELDKITAGYGPLLILRRVGLHVLPGEIVCLIGPNGAGKSTVLRAVIGQIMPVEGRVLFLGAEVTHLSIEEKGRQGMIFIPQGGNIFPNLSVQENLEIAGCVLKDHQELKDAIQGALDTFPAIRGMRNRPARELSGGQRQMLALSRILLLHPELVLLDEPSLGLAPLVVEHIFEEIQGMNQAGIAFLLVEQNARKGLAVSHRGYVLELGKNRLTGTGEALLSNPEVQRLYLGG
jgi:ABC-type branched-subunit amino acid transport system ATPase component